jgi:hypothetical protein
MISSRYGVPPSPISGRFHQKRESLPAIQAYLLWIGKQVFDRQAALTIFRPAPRPMARQKNTPQQQHQRSGQEQNTHPCR